MVPVAIHDLFDRHFDGHCLDHLLLDDLDHLDRHLLDHLDLLDHLARRRNDDLRAC